MRIRLCIHALYAHLSHPSDIFTGVFSFSTLSSPEHLICVIHSTRINRDHAQTSPLTLSHIVRVPPTRIGVNFMEKTITVRRTSITFSLWDLGGQREFVNMLPLVCNDAVAILFMFDLSRKSTLNSVKEWYRQARGFNKVRLLHLYFRMRQNRAKRFLCCLFTPGACCEPTAPPVAYQGV